MAKVNPADFADVRDEVIARFPKAYERAQSGKPADAIRLHCLECMGGSRRDAMRCETRRCFLWAHAYQKHRGAPVIKAQRSEKQLAVARANIQKAHAARG